LLSDREKWPLKWGDPIKNDLLLRLVISSNVRGLTASLIACGYGMSDGRK
jgi:hypothetical protein